jgi:hypothetical protein
MGLDNKIPIQNIVNRTNARRSDILDALDNLGALGARGNFIGHLPSTGDVIDAMGLARDATTFASVSRSLRRMAVAGLIREWRATLCHRGKGARWSR